MEKHFRFHLAPLCISTGLKMGCLFLGELAALRLESAHSSGLLQTVAGARLRTSR